jgi:hypothetical protein
MSRHGAAQVGTHRNTATVRGNGGRETNPADNVDHAVTVRTAATGEAEAGCVPLTISPNQILADGKPDRITVKVTARTKPVRRAKVIIFGVGVRTSGQSNASGFAFLTVNPRRAGLLTVTVPDARRPICGLKRIGVVEVSLAEPLTG